MRESFFLFFFCGVEYCVNWLVGSWFGWNLVGINIFLQGKPAGSAVEYRSLKG